MGLEMVVTSKPVVVWKGAPQLQPFLVEIASLEPFEGNPRRGDVERLRESLRRFGQVLPALADPQLSDGDQLRIVARHHLILAAGEEGWTHVAVIANEFASEEEARAFLVADNRLGQVGFVDEEALAEQLAALGSLEGTGYTEDDRDELASRFAALRDPDFRPLEDPDFLPSDVPPPRLDERLAGVFEVPLLLDRESRQDFARLVRLLQREWGMDAVTPVVVRAVREAAART